MRVERFLSQRDAAILCRLAEQLLRMRDANLSSAERLVEVISGSVLLPGYAERTDCVALFSRVTYRHVGEAGTHSVVLVRPSEANDQQGRMSVLAPVALALLGRPVGSIVEVVRGAAQVQYLEILQSTTGPAINTSGQQTHRSDALPYLKNPWPGY